MSLALKDANANAGTGERPGSPQAPTPHPVAIAPPRLEAWADGVAGLPYVHERQSGQPGPEVMITALIHGNEFAGAIALDAFLRSAIHPRRGRITAAFCNLAAFARFDARAPDASRCVDEDMNRVWSPERLAGPPNATPPSAPRDARAPSAELTRARALLPLLARATHLLDLHSMHERGTPLLVTGLLPRNIAFAQSLQTSAQAVADAGHADGVRMRDWGPFGDAQGKAIALLLEAGQHWDARSVAVSRNTLMRFLIRCGALDGADVPSGWRSADAVPAPPVWVTHRVVAQTMAFAFTGDFVGGETIARAGTVIAHDDGVPVATPYDHCQLVMPSVRQLRPGVTTVRFGKSQ